ncbi:MAG: FG-GAP-like repeat-containing protein [Bacteroidales bacterium]|nr:FG-GAP-like repeat-containing protein [Bacteroidales bacterium]MCF8457212.1 FG-GAP-like repeat-containing protein [Bacteroidales bacterium]
MKQLYSLVFTFLLMICFVHSQNVFQIGSIPTQTVYFGDTLSFSVSCQIANANYSINLANPVVGNINFNSQLITFTYIGNAGDSQFYVEFVATNGIDSISQSVTINPLPNLQPIPGTMSGYTYGSFNVNEAGAAVYSVPITGSPGSAGMEPKISLNYSSQGKNGLIGLGWSFGGLSTISRCPATKAQDNFIDGVDWDSNDRFALDGERLMAVLGGTYGADNTEYRTEQNVFNRIRSYGSAGSGPSYFMMWSKSGLIYEFGNTSDSKIEVSGGSSSTVMYWAVNKITDTKGNYITFTYAENNLTGEYKPVLISYTGNANVGLLPYNTIEFSYESRPDTIAIFNSGAVQKLTQRLQLIRTYNNNSLVRSYTLNYQNIGTGSPSQLISITECGSDGNCFDQPLIFEWQPANSLSFSNSANLIATTDLNNSNAYIYTGDWNGDGITDFMRYNYSTGDNKWYTNQGNNTFTIQDNLLTPSSIDGGMGLFFGDWNADGFSDVMWYNNTSGENNWFINQYTNGNIVFGIATYNTVSPYSNLAGGTGLYFGDWNGDGYTDVMWYKNSSGENRWYRNTISGNTMSFTEYSSSISSGLISGGTAIYHGDWNRDGITDVMWYNKTTGENKWFILSGNLTFTPFNSPITNSQISGGKGIYFGDWNGDQIVDLMWWNDANGSNTWFVNEGDMTFNVRQNLITTSSLSGGTQLYHNDLNADGFTDVLWYNSSSGANKCFLNQGYSQFAEITTPLATSQISGGTALLIGHYNKDDISDIFWYNNQNGTNNWFFNNAESSRFITKITNGHGVETLITYKQLIDNTIYTKDNQAVYPKMDFQGQLNVVNSFSVTNGLGGYNTISYKYFGALLDLQGRGFRGFTKMETIDETSGIKTINFFERDYKYISSKLKRTEQRLANGTLLSEVDNTLGLMVYYNGTVHYSYVSGSVAKKYELDNNLNSYLISTTTNHQTFDDYGNLTMAVVDYGDGNIDTSKNFYTNHYDTWILSRLDSAVVIRHTPGQPTLQRISTFEYEPNTGLISKETIEPGIDSLKLEKTYTHDDFGNIIQTHLTGYNGLAYETRTHTTNYDTQGRFVLESINAFGHTETKSYEPLLGNMISLTGPNGLTTTWQYDGFGRKIKETTADGNQSVLSYRKCNTSFSAPNAVYFIHSQSTGSIPSVTYNDILDREVRKVSIGFDGTAIYVDQQYNKRGQVVQTTDPYFSGTLPQLTTFLYDTVGRQITRIDPGNRISHTYYNGLTITVSNPLNQTATKISNAMGRMLSSKDNQNNAIQYVYDAFGNIIQLIDPAGNTTEMQYDIRGNKISMTDPDMGSFSYTLNSFGELISETDANGNITQMTYDGLGRPIQRTETEGITTWIYDTQPYGIGKLTSIAGPDSISEVYHYNDLGRLFKTDEIINNQTFSSSNTFDQFGRAKTLVYPSGFSLNYVYNQYNFLTEVRRNSDNFLYWKAENINERGQLVQQKLGNNATTLHDYNDVTGFLEGITTTHIADTIQSLGFQFNEIGNLVARSDIQRGLQEDFWYDDLNRLIKTKIAAGDSTFLSYDILGNILTKSDVGTYIYGENGAGPHQVTTVHTLDTTICIPSLSCNILYTSYDKVKNISEGIKEMQLFYGPNHSRKIIKHLVNDSITYTKYYVGNLYELEITPEGTRELHYIRGGEGVVAVYTEQSNGQSNTRYWHKDHLGSVQAISNEQGTVVEILSYDAWGKRRTENWTALPDSVQASYMRGFTGHEHIDLFNLINMDGRIYDPILGRFISPDPYIQAPENTQSLNRYSYCLNNPLSLFDPSGYKSFWSQIWKPLVAVIVGVLTAGIALAIAAPLIGTIGTAFGTAWAGFATAVVSGAGFGFGMAFSGSLLAGGSIGDAFKVGLTAGAISAVTAGLTFGIGEFFKNASDLIRYTIKPMVHGIVQGASRVVQGGKFEQGFYAGLFSSALGPMLENTGLNDFGKAVGYGIIGGAAEEIGGGNFVNGAATGAFIYLFNERPHNEETQKNINPHGTIEKEPSKTMGKFFWEGIYHDAFIEPTLAVKLLDALPFHIPTLLRDMTNQSSAMGMIGVFTKSVAVDVIFSASTQGLKYWHSVNQMGKMPSGGFNAIMEWSARLGQEQQSIKNFERFQDIFGVAELYDHHINN